jgi:hypothetical protein
MVSYLTSIFHGAQPVEKCGIRTARELRTLAEALDALGRGKLPQVADLLMQRYKALELSVTDGSWGLAEKVELLPPRNVGLTSIEESQAAARAQLLQLKLDEARKRGRGGASGSGG